THFFFFQAEDGIRHFHVTGVQTCALPICNHMRWILPEFTLRLTTDVPIRFLRDHLPFVLGETVHMVFGADESLTRSIQGYVEEEIGRASCREREWIWGRWASANNQISLCQ